MTILISPSQSSDLYVEEGHSAPLVNVEDKEIINKRSSTSLAALLFFSINSRIIISLSVFIVYELNIEEPNNLSNLNT